MVNLQTVRASNADLKSIGAGLVAVFVGATSGIGETTAREFVRNADRPRVYLVGRNETQASNLIEEFTTINSSADVKFIQSDVSLLRNVDKVCDEIKAKESHLNLLFLSQGIMTTRGRDETPEGLDKKFALHYYSRLRFVDNLLPLLQEAPKSTTSPTLSRVVSVLAAGYEGRLNTNDLQLKQGYSLKACADHATTMNSLALGVLAAKNPDVSFLHSAPGGVKTGLARDLGFFTKTAMNAIMSLPISLPMILSPQQSGERHVYALTNKAFAANGDVHLTGYSNERSANEKLLKEYKGEGVAEAVWKHTQHVFAQIKNVGRYE